MCFSAEGFSQELLIKPDNIRVFMGLTDCIALIDTGQSLSPLDLWFLQSSG